MKKKGMKKKYDERIAYSFSGMLPKPYLKRLGSEPFKELAYLYPGSDMRYTWVSVQKGNNVIKLKKLKSLGYL